MKKAYLSLNLQTSFLREGDKFIAYAPALDLSTSGDTYEQAKKRFEEVVEVFFEEIFNKGTLNEVLEGLGWKKVNAQWQPPLVVGQESQTINIPLYN
jgi:predicted RNase H-like HicB family nuclease